jgi:enediyne biosynthesis protein E4
MSEACRSILLLWISLGVQVVVVAQGWREGPGYRSKELEVPSGGMPGFTLLRPEETGVRFTNSLPESRSLTNTIAINGSGVAAGDVDGDGLCDLFFCGLSGGSRLYRNLGGWHFENITERAGIACTNLDATAAVFADINGDGHLDLVVNSIGGGTHVFINNGQGRFGHSPQVLNAGRGGTALALADASGRGWLDLYVANYRASTIMDAPGTRFSMKMVNGQAEVALINGRPPTDPEWTNRFRFRTETDDQGRSRLGREELGEPDVFFRNDGRGGFEAVTWTGGGFLDAEGKPLTAPPFDWGLSVMFRDFNGDGWPDIYVCNDFQSPDRFWLNDGQGHFRAAPDLTLRETSFSSMGMDVADLNRDGFDDFMVVDMLSRDHRRRMTQRNTMYTGRALTGSTSDREQYPRNTLFMNRGDGTYAEIAQYAGLEASEWSWAPIFLDVDLDGYEDVLVPNGFVRDNMNVDVQNQMRQATAPKKIRSVEDLSLRKMFPRLATPNLAFHNCGELRFEEVGKQWGFDTAIISQGACLADLDNDGDLDVIANNLNDPAGLYRNNASAPRIAVRLRGVAPNTRGIGTRIRVTGGPVPQSQEMMCGGRYLSCDDTLRVFAAGSLSNRMRLEVTWRSGKRSVVADAKPNCLYEIAEAGASEAAALPPAEPVAPMFEDVSERLGHRHQEEPFDDFARQPLLPKRLSQLGPGVCWWDVDGDSWEDLIIGSGKGGQLAWYQNDGKGGFRRSSQVPWTGSVSRDQTGIVGWTPGTVLVGSANYEDGQAGGAAVEAYGVGQGKASEVVGAWDGSAGPLAVADYNGDGELDLFVGGRVKAGRYPEAASSRLYQGRGGRLVPDEANSERLREVGLVSGVVWSDLDGDGWPELSLACEWGPLRVIHNDHGRLVAMDFPVSLASGGTTTLSRLTGWWNGVTTGDLDGDGRMDIIASNWGRNTKYEHWRKQPLRIYYGDMTQSGEVQLLESHFEPDSGTYVPSRLLERVTQAIPLLAGRFPTHQSWADAGIAEVMGERRDAMQYGEAGWLETTALLNRGDHFEARLLPLEAQLAPSFAVCVADCDGDGKEDVFLSQNFFAVNSDTSPYDACRGLWLQGDGQGGLRAIPGQESGINVYGEQRGAAVCDFDGDGRTDLVVSQNGGETRLFHNLRGRPGLRVRLRGPAGNPLGIGAVVRLKFGDRLGPAREIHDGSGYWSQDSVVQVMSGPSAATQIWVRWLAGAIVTADLPPSAKEVVVDFGGAVRQTR